MSQQEAAAPATARRKPHWIAGLFYLGWAVLGVLAAVNGAPAALVVTALATLYAVYLFRGGRFVVFFW